MHEVVTIQIGQQANHVGTHFWNIQESYFTYTGQEESPVNHDIHFRSGVGADGSDTYLPRVVIYDFKSSFGSLRKINELYEVIHEDHGRGNIWNGNTTVTRLPTVEQNIYQQHLSQGLQPPKLQPSDVRYWSDYNRIYYHPRSLVQLYETDLEPDQRAFDTWSSGEDLFRVLDNEHDLFDRDIRPMVEECDQLQGLQILTSVEGGWGGFTAKYMERFQDEMGKAATWVWALGEGQDMTPVSNVQQARFTLLTENEARRVAKPANEARAIFEISTAATMYVPLLASPSRHPSYLSMHGKLAWYTSALQATVLESLTLPSRLRRARGVEVATLAELSVALNPNDERKIAQARFSISSAQTLANGANMLSQVVPDCDLSAAETESGMRTFAELDVYRGEKEEDEPMGNGHAHVDNRMNGNARSGHDEDIQHYRRLNPGLPFPLLDSFPELYKLEDEAATTTPIRAQLAITSATSTWISHLERSSRLRVSSDEREALSNGLHGIAEAYKGGFSDDEEWDL